jgi:hypothetical protein
MRSVRAREKENNHTKSPDTFHLNVSGGHVKQSGSLTATLDFLVNASRDLLIENLGSC